MAQRESSNMANMFHLQLLVRSSVLSLATLPISVQLSCSSAAEISQDWSSSLRFRTSSEQTGKVIAWSFHCTESVTRFFGEQETNDKAQEWTESVSHFLGAPWGPCTGSWSSSELARLVLQKSAHTSNTDRRHHPAWASDVIWQHSICRERPVPTIQLCMHGFQKNSHIPFVSSSIIFQHISC